MFGKTIFSFPRNYQNALKYVFAKHSLGQKKNPSQKVVQTNKALRTSSKTKPNGSTQRH
jgi:hypothetical protein